MYGWGNTMWNLLLLAKTHGWSQATSASSQSVTPPSLSCLVAVYSARQRVDMPSGTNVLERSPVSCDILAVLLRNFDRVFAARCTGSACSISRSRSAVLPGKHGQCLATIRRRNKDFSRDLLVHLFLGCAMVREQKKSRPL